MFHRTSFATWEQEKNRKCIAFLYEEEVHFMRKFDLRRDWKLLVDGSWKLVWDNM